MVDMDTEKIRELEARADRAEAEVARLTAQLQAVRAYAEDRAFHARGHLNTVNSGRIASDLLAILDAAADEPKRPEVVCLCGSTRFRAEFTRVNAELSAAGSIVLAPGVFAHDGDPMTEAEKVALDELHKRKIDLADRVLVINVDGYIGSSTRSEIDYALARGKPVDYLEPKGDEQ